MKIGNTRKARIPLNMFERTLNQGEGETGETRIKMTD
jgi:hypothetical protein